jgi:acetyl esterase
VSRARRLWLLVAAVATGCGGIRPGLTSGPAPRVESYREVGGRALRAFIFEARAAERLEAPATTGAVLLLHGGGWSEGAPDWVFPAARAFANAGLVAIAVEYRLSDSTHTPIDALDDVCAALRWTRSRAETLRLDTTQIAAYGVSAGGHLAAATVTVGCPPRDGAPPTRGADALVLLSPALDVEADAHFGRLLLGRATSREYSPLAHPSAAPPPTMIAHGERDTLTPLEGSQRYCILVVRRRVQCDLRVYAGLGHLLTRNLEEQERSFDPDPVARADALEKQVAFLRTLWAR